MHPGEDYLSSAQIVKMASVDGYFEAFYAICHAYPSYYQAYQAIETAYYYTFGEYKYSTYDSFRQMKYRYLKKIREKNHLKTLK